MRGTSVSRNALELGGREAHARDPIEGGNGRRRRAVATHFALQRGAHLEVVRPGQAVRDDRGFERDDWRAFG